MADLRHVEADLKPSARPTTPPVTRSTRRRACCTNQHRRGPPGGEIRYVVEGRQRAEQRWCRPWLSRSVSGPARKKMPGRDRAPGRTGQAGMNRPNCWPHRSKNRPSARRNWKTRWHPHSAQPTTSAPRVGQVQQQIQVLAAEQRSIEEQFRQATQRHERLTGDRSNLAAPDESRLRMLESELAVAQENAAVAEARLHELQGPVPNAMKRGATSRRRSTPNRRARPRLSARMDAPKALQDKVKTDGTLQPWLAKRVRPLARPMDAHPHRTGLGIGPEAALRERLAPWKCRAWNWCARLAQDAPPAKLAFTAACGGARRWRPRPCRDCRTRCVCTRPGKRPC